MQLTHDVPATLASPKEQMQAVASSQTPAADLPRWSGAASLKVSLAIARPDHWFKNVFMALGVVLAYFCHPEVFDLGAFGLIVWAVVTTCLIASSNYVLNEILDAP